MMLSSSSAVTVTNFSINHADHGVETDLLTWALAQVSEGFFIWEGEIPSHFPDLQSGLYGPLAGDLPIEDWEVTMARRSPDRPLSRLVARPKRATRHLTVIGVKNPDKVKVFTAYGGRCAPREPGDPSLVGDEVATAEAVAFWSQHALAR